MSGKDDFLSRWSRRKRTGAEDDTAGAAETPVPEVTPPAATEPETRTDAEILEELGLRDPDTLSFGDDFKAYLQQAVPAHIKRRALRRLWRSNPVLAVRDGLNDYDLDESLGTVPKGALKTSYRVGRGFANRALSTVLKDPPEEMQDTESSEENAVKDSAESTESPPEIESPPDTVPQEPGAAPRRRMVFRVPGDDEG